MSQRTLTAPTLPLGIWKEIGICRGIGRGIEIQVSVSGKWYTFSHLKSEEITSQKAKEGMLQGNFKEH
jgi:hypothetical protein